MECQASDSKKVFKVFDASKNKRSRKRRDGAHDANSVATDDSTIGYHHDLEDRMAPKASLQDLPTVALDGQPDGQSVVRAKTSSPSISRSSHDGRRNSPSPRRHRITREGVSLALKAGMVSTPRSISPPQRGDGITDVPQEDSFIYAFLEEAIKRDKKKTAGPVLTALSINRHHSRRHEERRLSRDEHQERSVSREHRHRHRRNKDDQSKERDKRKGGVNKESPSPGIDQAKLLDTFAKLCAQMNDKTTPSYKKNTEKELERTQSHKSLQCEVSSRVFYDERPRPKPISPERSSHEIPPYKIRSSENCSQPNRLRRHDVQEKCGCCYDHKYSSKIDVTPSRIRHEDGRYRVRDHDYPDTIPTRNFVDYQNHPEREYPRDYEKIDRRHYGEEKRRIGQTTSRSFEVQREPYDDRCRRTTRSDKTRHYDDKYYDKGELHDRHFKERRRRNFDRFERNSVVSRDDEYRDRYSEKERDSGLSAADGETSTVSGRSNYLRAVKQEIAEQREAMDKMMKLWKELMRCFKGISHTQATTDNNKINQSAENVRESAAAQLRLWRECMRRYETVARDVGDTDARLMEEINKQRSEMAEMANMWQECLQRYRDMSNDFNALKQQLTTSESPTRLPAPTLACAEGEAPASTPKYCIPPHHYPPQMMSPVPGAYGAGMGGAAGAPMRGRASAPPWWWGGGAADAARDPDSPRRRSSPDSRASSRRRHRHKDSREESRYKEKSKPTAARSEHRHRKR